MNIEKFNNTLVFIEKNVGTILVGILFLSLTINIIFRYVFNHPLMWGTGLANYIFVWMGFLGAAYVLGDSKLNHLSVHIFHDALPKKMRLMVDIIIDLALAIFFLLLLPSIINVFGFLDISPTLRIPEKYIYIILPIVDILYIFHLVINITRHFKSLKEVK